MTRTLIGPSSRRTPIDGNGQTQQLVREAPSEPATFNASIVAPHFRHEPDWPWLTRVGPLRSSRFSFTYIRNDFTPFPKATRPYLMWQYACALRRIRHADIAFTFSTDINIGLSGPLATMVPGKRPRRIYVGFTQDGRWSQARMKKIGRALRSCDAVTMFTEQERAIYIERYALDPDRAQVIPIHTDDTTGYAAYESAPPPIEPPYVVSLGITNRRFTGVAQICRDLGIPLVILTRPHHQNDSLKELAKLGATVVTDADQPTAWAYLKHARLAVMIFMDNSMPGGYTTLMNAMFMQTPFIASDCLGMKEHVIDGETGFVTPHGDDDALRLAIDRLWNEPGLAERFGAAALERAQCMHSLESAAERFHRLACEVIARSPIGA